MFQQLLNTTAIWLLCLLAYDVFLGKETYHRYNRLYLLTSLLLGIILPAISWQTDTVVSNTVFTMPLQQVADVKQSIETTVIPTTTTTATTFNAGLILLFIYIIGVVVSLVILGREILLLTKLYRKGTRHKEGSWIVVETNQPHGPFSIFNCIFVGNKKLYDEREWNILLSHEGKHISQRHFIDIVLIQLAKIVFWFHPLIYIFQKRILMIHEYEADVVGADKPSEYGTFLIEQAMLQATPAITHSFNRSPIKKRIFMLTKTSSKRNMLKALVAIPVVLCCMFCFTKSAYSFKKGGENTVIFKGNTFEFDVPKGASFSVNKNTGQPDDIPVMIKKDGQDNSQAISVSVIASPVKMNGKTIYSIGEVTKKPVFLGKDKSLSTYLLNSIRSETGKLEDGEYFIHVPNPIVDEKGSLVYYEVTGVTASGEGKVINRSVKESIDNKLKDALDKAPKFKPAELKGKAVICLDAWAIDLGYRVIVKNHNAKVEYKEPHQY
jgi:beta-lactamase regulating signal transducer with metallopeptidase domain